MIAALRHELRTRLRSPRFYSIAFIYILICAIPPAIMYMVSIHSRYFIGASGFASSPAMLQPIATALFIAALAVDAITRERDEGSLTVTALAPFSAMSFVLRRWLAVMLLAAPITLSPNAIAWGLASASLHHLPPVAMYVMPWCIRIVPIIVICSALALALGTIFSQTVLAAVACIVIFTAGVGLFNNVLAHTHRRLDGIASLIDVDGIRLSHLIWALRGWGGPGLPSAAGTSWIGDVERSAANSALPFAIAALLLGITPFYLRRTRPDIRPWHIRDDHPLATLLRMLNRIRIEFTPDALVDVRDRVLLAAAVIIAIGSTAMVIHRYDAFARLAGEEYSSLTHGPRSMDPSVVLTNVTIEGVARRDGTLHVRSAMTFRNDSDHDIQYLAFAVTPSMKIVSPTVERLWDHVGINLTEPLRPRESRRIEFVLAGIPGKIRFPFVKKFDEAYGRFARANTTVDLIDLSRSSLDRSISRNSMKLHASDLMPVPRYSPWSAGEEQISPAARISVRLDLPDGIRAGDSCANVAEERLTSECTTRLASYSITGAHFRQIPLDADASMLVFEEQVSNLEIHKPAIVGAIRIAREAWPRLAISGRELFIERPTELSDEDYFLSWQQVVDVSGASYSIAERLLIRKEPLDSGTVATAIVVNTLRSRRRVVPAEAHAFMRVYQAIAATDTGGQKGIAVVPGTGGIAPGTTPILTESEYETVRPRCVIAEIENRTGHDRMKEGVQDFLAASEKPGTMRELLDAIGRRGGVDLSRVYSDYFAGTALPRLTLENLQFIAKSSSWEVRGELVNKGSGESFCPIKLRTTGGVMKQTIRVDTGMRVPFVFNTPYAPRTLQLDPDRTCYRFAYIGSIESVDYKGPQS